MTFMARTHNSGFSLVEMLITIAIIGLITAVIMARYDEFDDTVTLRNLAYEVALSVREAQVLGISVRGESGTFTNSYGAHFEIGNTYILFQDLDGDGVYDEGEEVTTSTIGGNNTISALCADADCSLTALDITFERPDPDANIVTTPSAGSVGQAQVVVEAGNGNTASVTVRPSGQISVD